MKTLISKKNIYIRSVVHACVSWNLRMWNLGEIANLGTSIWGTWNVDVATRYWWLSSNQKGVQARKLSVIVIPSGVIKRGN